MTRQSAAAYRQLGAADAMPEGTRARMAAGGPAVPVTAGSPVTPWILLGLGVGLILAVGAVWVVAWATGGFPIGDGGMRR